MGLRESLTAVWSKIPVGNRTVSIIKSVQRGTITDGTASDTATATITAVVTAKTILANLGSTSTTNSILQLYYLELTNTTTITATRKSGGNTSWVSYQAVETH